MSKFKVKKLAKQELGTTGTLETNEKIKKRLRIFVASLLTLFVGFFIFEIIAQSVGNIRISSNTEVVFNPIIFGGAGAKEVKKGQTNILIAGIGGQGHE